MKSVDLGFEHGCAWAIAMLSRDDSPSCRNAQFLFNEAGLKLRDYALAGVDQYDLDEIAKVSAWKEKVT